MKQAIITGGTGFIGRHLVDCLLHHGVQVCIITRQREKEIARDGLTCVSCDLLNIDALEHIPNIGQDTVFYHLAWNSVDAATRQNALLQTENIKYSLNAVLAANKLSIPKFIGMGTVYERLLPLVRDSATPVFSDYYIMIKNTTHYLCRNLARRSNIDFTWATTFHPLGKYIKPSQLIAYVIKGLIDNNPPLLGPATEPFDMIAAEDIANALFLLGEKDTPGDEYYIGSGKPMLLCEYLELAREVLQVNTELRFGARPDDGLRFDFSWFDISPLVRDTGYTPTREFQESVKRTAEYLREIR